MFSDQTRFLTIDQIESGQSNPEIGNRLKSFGPHRIEITDENRDSIASMGNYLTDATS